jgi:acyl-CoA synthetase (NDP forming)
VLVDAPYIDSVILISTLHRSELLRRDFALLQQIVANAGKPIVFYSYTRPSAESKRLLRELGLPFYPSSTRAVRGLRALTDYAEFQRRERGTGGSTPVANGALPSTTRTRALSEFEATQLLTRAGFPTCPGRLVRSAAAAREAARELGMPVALKLQSPDLAHKSSVGGVLLNVRTLREVRAGYTRLMEVARSAGDDLRLEGVLVQPMAPPGVEVIIGVENASGFGPLVLLGLGGARAEQLRDTSMRAAPVDLAEARGMLTELRAGPIVLPENEQAAGPDIAALLKLLVELSSWAARNARSVCELDLNPVIVHPRGGGVSIVDAFMVLAEESAPA